MAAYLNSISSNDSRLDTSRSVREEEKKLVIIKWRDVISDDSWTLPKDVECPTLYSVGWLVKDDEDTVKIASTLDPDDFSGEVKDETKPVPYGITAFPKGCVLEIKFI